MKKMYLFFALLFMQICFSQVVPIADGDALGPLVEFKNKEYLILFGANPGIRSTDGVSSTLGIERNGLNGNTYSFTAKNNNFLYVVENAQSTTNLLVTNGSGGFTEIKSFTTSSSGSLPKVRLAPTLSVIATEEVKRTPNNFIGDKLIFTAIDPTAQIMRLWISEGTSVSTVKLLSSTGSEIDVLDDSFGENINGLVYFNGRTTTAENYHLWRTDGTSAGTYPVTNSLAEKLYTPTKSTIESINGELLFIASTTNTISPSADLWKTNGTPTGTVKLIGVVSHGVYNNVNTMPKFFGKVFKNNFYFFANNGTLGAYVLYKTDGTVTGTVLLKSSSNQNIKMPSVSSVFYNDDDYIYFPGKGRKEFAPNFFIDWDFYYASQGNQVDTKPIDDLSNMPTVNYVYKTNNGLIVNTGNNSYKFKGYDKPIKTVFTSTQLNLLGSGFSKDSKIWFSASEGSVNEELWCSDGTQSGTKRFADIIAGSGSSGPKGFFTINNDLFVFAKFGSQTGGFKIYKIGEDYTFNGTTSNNWNIGSNWNAGSSPTSVDNATIPSGFVVDVNAIVSAKNISIASPINLIAGNIDIYGNATVLNSAKITLNANNLNLKGNNSSIAGNATSYIITNGTGKVSVENVDTARGSVMLPIGTTTNYNPITLSNIGASDSFSARVESGLATNYTGEVQGVAITEKGVNATWFINEGTVGGSNANIQLQWNESQELPNFDRPTTKMGHYNGTVWESLTGTLAGASPYTYVVNGVTSFSPFAVLNEVFLGTSQFEVGVFKLYPNPSNGDFTLQTTLEMIGAKAEVYNVMGQKIKSFELSGIETKQNLMNQGFYIVVIEKDGKKVTQKITIK